MVLVASAYRTSPRFDLVADARFLILDNRYTHELRYARETIARDYFWSSSGAHIRYWRPATRLSWLLEWQAFGRRGGGYHIVGVAWHLLAVAGVMRLALLLAAPRAWAGAAGLLYGLHAAAVEPTCLVMARSDVVAAASSIWAVAAWLAWRRAERRRRRVAWAAAHAVAVAIALASKEVSVALVPLLAVWAALDGDLAAGRRRALLTLAPGVALCAAYLLLRARVLGGATPGATPDATFDALRVFAGGAAYLRALLPFRLETGVRNLSLAEARDAATLGLAAATWIAVAAGVVAAARARAAWVLAPAAWIAFSLAPVLLVRQIAVPNVQDGIPLFDRWLLQAAAAASLLWALAAARAPWRHVRAIAGGAVALWGVLAWSAAPFAHAAFATEAALMDLEEARYQETPERFRTPADRCRHESRRIVRASRRGEAEEAARIALASPPECARDSEQAFNVLSALVAAGRFAEARPLVARVLATDRPPRFRAPALLLSGAVLLATGETAAAERLLGEAERLGLDDCGLPVLLARAADARGDASERDRRLAEAARCRAAPR